MVMMVVDLAIGGIGGMVSQNTTSSQSAKIPKRSDPYYINLLCQKMPSKKRCNKHITIEHIALTPCTSKQIYEGILYPLTMNEIQ